MQILFLSCSKATSIIEKQFHFRLSFIEKLQLSAHKSMCKACTNYEKQSRVLEQTIQQQLKEHDVEVNVTKLKEEIIIKLTNK